MADAEKGRPNQKSRTRKDLLRAAATLMKEGKNPTLEEIAETAMVSRATAYRYFSGVEALLVEAALDVAMPDESFFAEDPSADPAARVLRADAAVSAMILENEAALRAMLMHSLQRRMDEAGLPVRQNRRTPLIEQALAPVRGRLAPADFTRLVRALALVIGTESMIVFRDVLAIGDDEAAEVRAWMIRALIAAALEGPGEP
ncbi:TetR/AcrR family transcriptional regulator [Allosphingosinicella sp.]|uniref:TetR/AcrR family transcriptional regulator n=1 Tax=Allosphingosinicella sp. TaxID=2823234 RepID=UPI00378519C0